MASVKKKRTGSVNLVITHAMEKVPIPRVLFYVAWELLATRGRLDEVGDLVNGILGVEPEG